MRRPTLLVTLKSALSSGVAAAALLAAGQAAALPVAGPGPALVNPGGAQPIISSGGGFVAVDLNAQRTIIDWQSFNLASGERADFLFDQRNWIVLNRVTGSAIDINGQVFAAQAANLNSPVPATASGNVWFYSPQGVAFGPNARVDVGGMLATSAAVDTSAFLNTAALNIPFTGSGAGGPVTVAGGAQFTGKGHIAFVAPSVTTGAGSNVDAGDYGTAAYGAADSFELQFTPTFNNDLTFFTFIVPNVAGATPIATPLQIAGSTKGANVYLVAMSRAALTGVLINAPGLLTGQSSFVEYGQVTISTGRNIVSGQVGAGAETQQVAGVTTGSVRLGEINAGGNSNIYLTGTGSLGDLTADKIHAGQAMIIGAHNITIGAGGLTVGDSPDPRVGARRDLFIDSAGIVDIQALSVGGNLNFARGAAQAGRTVDPSTIRLGSVNAGGDFVINGAGQIDAGVVTAGGQAVMFATLPVTLISLTTNGYTRVSSSKSITAATIRGVDLDLRSVEGITATTLVGTTSVAVGTAGDAVIGSITGPALTLDAATARLGTVDISGDARLRVSNFDPLTSFSAANLTVESQTGALSLGGMDQPGVTDQEFQRIKVTGEFNIYGGLREASVNVPVPVFGDLTVDDLSIDPLKVPSLNLFAKSANKVLLRGSIQPTAAGASLRVGNSLADDGWSPGAIILTGALGSASGDILTGFTEVKDFSLVQLYAANDILIGSERFVELVSPVPAEQIDIDRSLPLGVAPTEEEVGRLFVVSSQLRLAANDRVVQQNTGAVGQQAGLYLTGAGVEPGAPVLQVGWAKVADLFGAIAAEGGAAGGQQLSFSTRIGRLEGDTSQGFIRINGCPLGIGCAVSTPSTQFRIGSFRPAATRAAVDPPVLTPPPRVDEDEREAESVVTGTGNEEIWRSQK